MKRVPLTYEGKIVGYADVEDCVTMTGVITDPKFIRYVNDDLQYLSIDTKDKNENN
jgi:hypothetical protein